MGAGERRLLAVMLALALLAGVMPRGTQAATGDPVLLNELLVSHTGTDTAEFVELYGVPGTPLSGLSLVFVEGDGAGAGLVDRRVDFPAGARLGGNGYYLVGNPAGLGTHYHVVPDLAAWPTDALENGSQTVALVEAAGLGDVGTSVTGSETVRDAVGLTDAGASDQWFWSAPVVGPDDGFLPGGARRVAIGVDTDSAADWAFADDLLGPSNTPTPATPYNAVQDTCGHQVFGRHPWAPMLFDSRGSSGPSGLRYFDWVLGVLMRAGFSIDDAPRAFSLLDSYIYGFGIEQMNFSAGDDVPPEERAEAMLAFIPVEQFPYLHQMASHAMQTGYDAEADFDFGLEIILDGLARMLGESRAE
jgi:hypothetical protein